MKKFKYIAAIMVASMIFTACANKTADTSDEALTKESSDDGTNVSAGESTITQSSIINQDKLFSNRDLSGEYDVSECESITLSDNASKTSASKGVTISENTITITKEGDYIIEGTLSDGMIIVDVDDSEKVQLVLNGVSINSETSAAIFVKNADKVFVTLASGTTNTLSNGGEFVVLEGMEDTTANIDAVIFSKDDLTLNGTGTLEINSPAGHGVVSKNDLVITGGTYNITAASHGFSGKDSVAVADGTFNVTAGKDGIHSENDDDDEVGYIYIADGSFNFDVESDGMSAVNEIYVAGGNIVVTKSYEGLEARLINIMGGTIDITSSDDGLNATDKRSEESGESTSGDNFGFKGGFGGGGPMGDTQDEANINITGGVININAEGDGVDSNGYFTMSGGELYVTGPSNGGNGALDYGIDATITGGIVVAAGQSDMAVNFGSDSTQGSILVNTSSQNEAGTKIVLTDSAGNNLIEWTMEKRYNSVVISCPEIVDGGTYTVSMGDNTTEVTMDGLIYGSGFDMGHGGFGGGGFGGKRGNREEMTDGQDMPQMPSGEGEMPDKPDDNDKKDKHFDGGKPDETVTGGGREIPFEGNSDNTKKE
jgi:hypothetical protein